LREGGAERNAVPSSVDTREGALVGLAARCRPTTRRAMAAVFAVKLTEG
jgi:hypothetical protein